MLAVGVAVAAARTQGSAPAVVASVDATRIQRVPDLM